MSVVLRSLRTTWRRLGEGLAHVQLSVDPFPARPVRGRRMRPGPSMCTSWYGHNFVEVVTGQLLCLHCATTRSLSSVVDRLLCTSWGGHHMKWSRGKAALYCQVCAAVPVVQSRAASN